MKRLRRGIVVFLFWVVTTMILAASAVSDSPKTLTRGVQRGGGFALEDK